MKIILANPRGFCAGVGRAIEIVNKVLEQKAVSYTHLTLPTICSV